MLQAQAHFVGKAKVPQHLRHCGLALAVLPGTRCGRCPPIPWFSPESFSPVVSTSNLDKLRFRYG